MAKVIYESLDHELHSRGYLSLAKALKWLEQYHPTRKLSWPVALRLIKAGCLEVARDGNNYIVSRGELEIYVQNGPRTKESKNAN